MIVIPDIHGRTFWKYAIQGNEDKEIIFLGDYMDPYYQYETDITFESAVNNFKEILELKKQHPENVILLLGNHDFHYMYNVPGCWRYDKKNASYLKKLYRDNESLFQLMYQKKIGDKVFLFSHAGVRETWLHNNRETINSLYTEDGKVNEHFADDMNNRLHNCTKSFINTLTDVGPERGGYPWDAGSPIWADVREHIEDDYSKHPDIFQVFGHTQLQETGKPIITDNWTCLDCRAPFYIDDNTGEIKSLIKKKR